MSPGSFKSSRSPVEAIRNEPKELNLQGLSTMQDGNKEMNRIKNRAISDETYATTMVSDYSIACLSYDLISYANLKNMLIFE